MRRAWTYGCLALAAGSLGAALAPPRGANPFPKAALDRLASEFQGRAGIYVKDLGGGHTYTYHAGERFPPASAIKLPIMVALYREAEAGRIDLDRGYAMPEGISALGTGDLSRKGGPIALTLREYCRLMMVKSDNMATDLIIRTLGIPRVNRFLREQRLDNTRLAMEIGRWHYTIVGMGREPISPVNDAKVRQEGAARRYDESGLAYSDSFENNVVCPRDLGLLLERLRQGRLAGPAATTEMFAIMSEAGRGRIGQYLAPGVRVTKKHGSSRRVAADAGIIDLATGPVVFVACALAKDGEPRGERELISRLARLACAALDPGSVVEEAKAKP
jgi:beta-lactamase class A